MRTLFAFLIASLMTIPGASATGYLINVEIGGPTFAFGANIFGGSGDTLDVGLFNTQCSDEADVVDVGVLNREGTGADECFDDRGCQHNDGKDPLGPLLGQSFLQGDGSDTPAECGDGDDTVDVGVLNAEGHRSHEPTCDPEWGCYEGWTGDERDATDAGVLNNEMGDDDDGNDLGVVNCEEMDRRDSTDVGVLNREWEDRWDTFDLSILNSEFPEGGDTNGLAIGGNNGFGFDCVRIVVGVPIGPRVIGLP